MGNLWNTRVRRLSLVFGALALVAALMAFAGPWLEPVVWRRAVVGVDVSRHQADIDWSALSKDGVAFAYIKASEGADYVDPYFERNWRQAGHAGLKRGAYHFFTLCRTGEEQARNFLRVAGAGDALPAAVDVEHMGPCRTRPAHQDPAAEIEIFLDRVERAHGRRPIVYTTRAFHNRFLRGRLQNEVFWVRSLPAPPLFRRAQWVLWQYSNAGRKAGVQGPVDLNMFRGDQARFEAWSAQRR